jgi:SWI/SNF-related matrix-associated actin-dependent regulator 1 of chromatin subfamily A
MPYGLTFISSPKIINKDGQQYEVVTAFPSEQFWNEWRSAKDKLKGEGYSVWKGEDGKWRVSLYTPVKTTQPTASDLRVSAPPGLEYRPYQVAGIQYMLSHPLSINADEPGLGKTIQTAGLINALDDQVKRILVICPAYLKLNWRDELRKWLTTSHLVMVDDESYLVGDRGIWITNYERITKLLDERELEVNFDLVVCDEAHYLKNPKALRTKVILEQVKSKRWVFLTGTPVLNRPIELWPLLRIVDRGGLGRNWRDYVVRYCAGRKGRWGWEVNGASNTEELGQLLKQRCMIRRRKQDVLKELPPKVRATVWLSGDNIARVVAREQEVLARLIAEYGSLRNLLASPKLPAIEELTKLRRDLALAKVPHAADLIADYHEESGSIVAFTWHREAAELLTAALRKAGLKSVCVHGGMSVEDRHEVVRRFQNGEIDVLVGTIAAMGTGVTLTRASRVVFLELPWQPGVLIQAEDRLHRIGQQDAVLCNYLLAEGSVDAEIYSMILEKDKIVGGILDGERNLKFESVSE